MKKVEDQAPATTEAQIKLISQKNEQTQMVDIKRMISLAKKRHNS